MSDDEKRWEKHAEFMGELARLITYVDFCDQEDAPEAMRRLVEFCLYEGMKHENKHMSDRGL